VGGSKNEVYGVRLQFYLNCSKLKVELHATRLNISDT